jgi:hypothetical protein
MVPFLNKKDAAPTDYRVSNWQQYSYFQRRSRLFVVMFVLPASLLRDLPPL